VTTGSRIDETLTSIFPCLQGNFPLKNLISTMQDVKKSVWPATYEHDVPLFGNQSSGIAAQFFPL
jgi:hypothetical protein